MKPAPTWKAFWDRLATSRDPIAATDRPTVSQATYQLYSAEIIEKLALGPSDVVLDIGCGTGLIDARLSEWVRQIYATDFSERMAQAARSNTAHRVNVHLAICDSTALPFRDRAFSKIVVYAVAQYLSEADIRQLLQEARRLTGPGGLILLGEVPRARSTDLGSRVRDILVHQGVRGVLRKLWAQVEDRWKRASGQRDQGYVRPPGPPVKLHSAAALLELVRQLNMRGWKLSQGDQLPWFHQTFDLVIENLPAGGNHES